MTTPTAKQLAASPGLMTSPLPSFTVNNDFQLDGTSTFARFAGGTGAKPTKANLAGDPYQIVDIYGLQGLGSPSGKLLAGNYELTQDIFGDTSEWNGGDGIDGGAGWVPIGEGGTVVRPFTGTLNGNNFVVDGIYMFRPDDDLSGLFGEVSGTVENLVVADNANGEQGAIASILTGRVLAHGVINDCTVGFDSSFQAPTGAGFPNAGTTANQAQLPLATLGVSNASGGLAGQVMAGGLVENSTSDGGYNLLGSSGVFGLTGLGGAVGINAGTVLDCVSNVASTTINSVQSTTSGKTTAELESINIGGLVGLNTGTINGGGSSGDIDPVGSTGTATPSGSEAGIISGIGNFNIGGFVGANYGTIDGTVKVGRTTTTYQAFTTDNITISSGTNTGPDVYGGTGSYFVGRFRGRELWQNLQRLRRTLHLQPRIQRRRRWNYYRGQQPSAGGCKQHLGNRCAGRHCGWRLRRRQLRLNQELGDRGCRPFRAPTSRAWAR